MEKIREHFEGMVVKKSSIQEVFSSLSLPAFIRDWFIKKYSDPQGNISVKFVTEKIKDILPRKGEWKSILDNLLNGEEVKFIAKINIKLDIKTNKISFSMPDFGVDNTNTSISDSVWDKYKKSLLCGDGDIWGIVKLGYEQISVSKNKFEGKIVLRAFDNFMPYNIDLKYYKKARENFELNEWIDVLLLAIDYNPNGYADEEQKLMVITRLLPFVEKRINLIELAPKGTGKSYLFSQISKKGWLSSGGVMTRAKMFYDMKTKQDGLAAHYDYIALDEIATIRFPDTSEMQGALKGYLESGSYTVGTKAGSGEAGLVLLGNIDINIMDITKNMFQDMPEVFSDSALIDRFHGFIEGWKIPRMSENLKANGWALNVEYFAEIMHALRDDIDARAIVDKFLEVPSKADTRDLTAIKRISSAFVKLLFPHWTVNTVDPQLLSKYCIQPAVRMRKIIKQQLSIIDSEFNKPFQEFKVKGIE